MAPEVSLTFFNAFQKHLTTFYIKFKDKVILADLGTQDCNQNCDWYFNFYCTKTETGTLHNNVQI